MTEKYKSARDYMRDHRMGRFCSRCGAEVKISPASNACVCAMCLNYLAGLRKEML